MEFDVNFKVDLYLAKKQIIKEIKEWECKTGTTEKIPELIQLYFIKSLIERLEVMNDLIKDCENKNAVLKIRSDEFSKLVKKQSGENKMLKAENEKLCNYLNELQSKLDNMEQHTAILEEEKEEIKQLLESKSREVAKLKVEICKIKGCDDDLKSKMKCNEDGSFNY